MPFLFQIYVEKKWQRFGLFLGNQLLHEAKIVEQKQCKKEFNTYSNRICQQWKKKVKVNLSKVDLKTFGRSISLSATCPSAFRLVQDQMRSTGETEIHQSCPELFDDGSKNNFEKYYIYEVNRVGGRRLGLWAHQVVDKEGLLFLILDFVTIVSFWCFCHKACKRPNRCFLCKFFIYQCLYIYASCK